MPTITSMPHNAPLVQQETFVPILHTFSFRVPHQIRRACVRYAAGPPGSLDVGAPSAERPVRVQTFEEAVHYNNEVHQGLTSAIFTSNPEYIFRFIGYRACPWLEGSTPVRRSPVPLRMVSLFGRAGRAARTAASST